MKTSTISAAFLAVLTTAPLALAQSTGNVDCSGTEWGPALQRDSNDLRDGCALDYDPDFHIDVVRDPRERTAPWPWTQMYLYEDDWDEGWGWTDSPGPADKNTPYCILAEAVSVLERAGVNTPDPDYFVLTEALDYIKQHTHHWAPKCKGDDFDKNANSGSPEWAAGIGGRHIRLYTGFFEMAAGNRAASLLHEAWHRGTNRRHGGSRADGHSRDNRYQSIYDESDSLFEGGVSTYSVHVAWLEDYIKIPDDVAVCKNGTGCPTKRATISYEARRDAFAAGNRILQTRFETPTSKRLNMFTRERVLGAYKATSYADPGRQEGVYDDEDAGVSTRESVLGALDEEPCGLMGIHGSFREEGDYVKIIEEQHMSNMIPRIIKVLRAHSEQKRDSRATGGLAACFPEVRFSFRPTWFEISGDDKSLRRRLIGEGEIVQTAANSTCFITGVEGRLEGEFDSMGVRLQSDDDWEVFIQSNSNEGNNFQRVQVACVDAPLAYEIDDGLKYVYGPDGEVDRVSNRRSDSVWYDTTAYPASGFSHQCVLSQVTGRMFNIEDRIWIREQDFIAPNDRTFECRDDYTGKGNKCTTWNLHIEGDGHLTDRNQMATATCFAY